MKKLVVIFALLPFVMGMRSCGWFPSSFFQGLDQNNDNQLSYQEWMAYYQLPEHGHSIEHCSRKDFYSADCDLDDQLTWEEYSDFRFHHMNCASPAVPTLRQMYESGAELQADTPRQDFQVLMSRWHKALIDREAQLIRRYPL